MPPALGSARQSAPAVPDRPITPRANHWLAPEATCLPARVVASWPSRFVAWLQPPAAVNPAPVAVVRPPDATGLSAPATPSKPTAPLSPPLPQESSVR